MNTQEDTHTQVKSIGPVPVVRQLLPRWTGTGLVSCASKNADICTTMATTIVIAVKLVLFGISTTSLNRGTMAVAILGEGHPSDLAAHSLQTRQNIRISDPGQKDKLVGARQGQL
jgi:hypothetical protein